MKARVFISSAISEFRSERRIAKEALSSAYPFLEVWVFEEEGASSASLEQSYQNPLERSDVVIFLLGEDITPPVVAEIDSAIRHNKRTLLILRDVPRRTDALQDAIKKLDVKYASYANIESFQGVAAERHRNRHEHAGAEIITGFDTSCLMHLEGLIRRENHALRVMHIAEILECAKLS